MEYKIAIGSGSNTREALNNFEKEVNRLIKEEFKPIEKIYHDYGEANNTHVVYQAMIKE